jgi:WhiB family transcriptional regulator, redox-sensing transcriptional regulator
MILNIERIRWRTQAACRDADPGLFQDSLLEKVVIEQFCRQCPVKPQCLKEALENDDVGVWGGTTQKERNYMKTPRMRKRCLMCSSRNIQADVHSGVCLNCGFSWRSKEHQDSEDLVAT